MQKNNLWIGIAILLATTACSQGGHLGLGGEDIATTAERHEGSHNWDYDGVWKCNRFVYDVLKETGVTAPVYSADGERIIDGKNRDDLNPVVSADWANSRVRIPDWDHLGKTGRRRGDVIAIRDRSDDATGHCGIAVSSSQVIAATSDGVTRSQGGKLRNGSVRRYTG